MRRCVLLVLVAWTTPVVAQQTDPIQPVALQGVGGELSFESRYREDNETRGPAQVENHERDLILREIFELNLDGYFYHPNLIDWTADLRAGLSQQDTSLFGEDRESNGDVLGYDIQALILKQKPASFKLWANRDDEFIDRSFARPIELETESQGGQFFLRGDVPVTVLFDHRTRFEQSDIRDNHEDTYEASLNVEDRRDRDLFSRFTYSHEDTAQTTRFLNSDGSFLVQDLPDHQDEATFFNDWQFDGDEDLKHRLTGRGRVLNRTGFFDNQVFQLDEQLTLAHTRSLSTFYRFAFDNDESEFQEDRTIHVEAGFSKSIYDSLVIVGRGYHDDRRLDNGFERTTGAAFDLDYRKVTPIGKYFSTLSLGTEVNDEKFDEGQRNVNDESVTLTAASPVELSQPNIAPGSIRVTDISNAITYVEGIDYLINQFGPVTEIRRLAGGSIAPGQTVFVDYTSLASEGDVYRTEWLSWGNRLVIESLFLSLYTQHRWRTETLTDGYDPGNLNNERDQLYGVEYAPPPWRFAVEYEDREHDLFTPWSAYRGRAGYTEVFGAAASFSAGIEYESLNYRRADEFGLEPGRDFLETYGAYANLTSKLNRNLLARVEASYYKTRGRNNDLLARIGGGLTWTRGGLMIDLNTHYDIWEQEIDNGTTLFLGLNVTRKF